MTEGSSSWKAEASSSAAGAAKVWGDLVPPDHDENVRGLGPRARDLLGL